MSKPAAAIDLTDLRLGMLARGFHPVPVMRFDATDKAAGKRPTLLKWEEVCATADEAEIRRWSVDHGQRDCLNTGLLCGHVIGLDIDVPDYPLACRINALADAMLPPTPLIRIGKSPKSLRAFRAEGVHTKASTPALFLPDGTKVQIEALGKGNHFVSFGTHPDTKLPYTWPHESPLDVRFEDLPVLPAATLRAFLKAAEAGMHAAGDRTEEEIKDAAEGKVKPAPRAPKKPPTTIRGNDFPPPTYDDVREALAAIPNRHDWKGWVKPARQSMTRWPMTVRICLPPGQSNRHATIPMPPCENGSLSPAPKWTSAIQRCSGRLGKTAGSHNGSASETRRRTQTAQGAAIPIPHHPIGPPTIQAMSLRPRLDGDR